MCIVDFSMDVSRSREGYIFESLGVPLGAASAQDVLSGRPVLLFAETIDDVRIGSTGERTGAISRDPLFEVPLPPRAERMVGLGRSIAGYELPVSANFDSLLDFYDRVMPAGSPWGELRWCESSMSRVGTYDVVQRQWHDIATNEFLVVLLASGDDLRGPRLTFFLDASRLDPSPCSGKVSEPIRGGRRPS